MYAPDYDGELDPLLMASHLLCYLARHHAFVDGNKRTAWLACEEQLRLVGARVLATEDEAVELVLAVVAKQVEADHVNEWLASRISYYDPGL